MNRSLVLVFVLCALAAALAATIPADGRPLGAPTPVVPGPDQPNRGEGLGPTTVHLRPKPTILLQSGEESEIPGREIADASGLDPARCELELRETDGAGIVARLTPQVPSWLPPSPGRLFVLRAGERRVVRLGVEFAPEDLAGNDILVEALGGAGRMAVSVLCGGEAEVVVERGTVSGTPAESAAGVVRRVRRKVQEQQLSTMDLIDEAVAAGTLDAETALVYKAFALFGDARLPAPYRGNDSARADSLELDEIRAAAPTMSPANQALVQPFLVPPAYQGSWAAQRASGTVHEFSSPPPCSLFAPNWSWLESPHGWVRVWFRSDLASEATFAQAIIAEVEGTIWPKFIGLMVGHAPLADDGESCNGGSGALDIYLTDLPPKYAGVTPAYRPGGAPTPAYILIDHAADFATVAHELFHAFQDSYQRLAGLTDQRYDWWTEASAEWSEDYVYHGKWGTYQRHLNARAFLAHPEQPLDLVDTATNRHYGAYLVPFYVANKTGSAAFVAQSWANCATQPALEALDAALPGGFAAIWPEVALHDWNEKPVDEYSVWDAMSWQATPSGGAEFQVQLGGSLDGEVQLTENLPRLSAVYKSFAFPDDTVSSVAFWNGASFDLEKPSDPILGAYWNPTQASASARKGVKIQALVKVTGSDWTIEDWTDKPYVLYCRDLAAERLEQLVVIISNSEYSDRNRRVTPPGLAPVFWASRMGCWQWKGSATYTATTQAGTQTDTVNDLLWTRIAGSQQPPSIMYLPTGHVNVTMTGNCTGSQTVPLSGLSSFLLTYNFTPENSAGRGGYQGAGAETGTVPVVCSGKPGIAPIGAWMVIPGPNPPQSPWPIVSTDGKRIKMIYNPGQGLTWTWDFTAQRQ